MGLVFVMCWVKMIILAIDPGLRNLAWCLMENGVVKDINRTDIFCGELIQSYTAFDAISAFCDRIDHIFQRADMVVIERQFVDNKIKLSSCLSIVQTVLQCRSYKRHMLVHAGTIKKFFRTHRGTHKLNKIAAVERATEYAPCMFGSMGGKLDDLADAFLLALYAHIQYRGKIPKGNTMNHYEHVAPTASGGDAGRAQLSDGDSTDGDVCRGVEGQTVCPPADQRRQLEPVGEGSYEAGEFRHDHDTVEVRGGETCGEGDIQLSPGLH